MLRRRWRRRRPPASPGVVCGKGNGSTPIPAGIHSGRQECIPAGSMFDTWCRSGIAELHLMLIRMVLVFWPRVDLCQSYNLPHPPTQGGNDHRDQH